jgi:hypothetical protein
VGYSPSLYWICIFAAPIFPDFASTSALAFHEKSGRCQGILWLGKFISMFSFCPDMYFVWLASRAVKAERSEFILSLDGPTSQP